LPELKTLSANRACREDVEEEREAFSVLAPRARREREASLRFDNIHASSAGVDSDADVESGNRTI